MILHRYNARTGFATRVIRFIRRKNVALTQLILRAIFPIDRRYQILWFNTVAVTENSRSSYIYIVFFLYYIVLYFMFIFYNFIIIL